MNSPALRRPSAAWWWALVLLVAAMPRAAFATDARLEELLRRYGGGADRSVYLAANADDWARRLSGGADPEDEEEGTSPSLLRGLALVGTAVVDAEVGDTQCPINVEVANVGDAPIWEAAVTVGQSTTYGEKQSASLTIPYIPAQSAARVEVTCAGYSGNITLDISPLAFGARLTPEVATTVATAGTDFSLSSSTYRPATASGAGMPGGPSSHLAAVWAYVNAGDRVELAKALGKSPQGLAGLGRVLRAEDDAWFAADVVPTLAPLARSTLAIGLVAREDTAAIGGALLDTVCPGKQSAALFASASEGEMNAGSLIVMQKCMPSGPAFDKTFAALDPIAQVRLLSGLSDTLVAEHQAFFVADPRLLAALRVRLGSVADEAAFASLSATLRALDEEAYLDDLIRGGGPGQPLRNEALVSALGAGVGGRAARLYGIALEAGVPSGAIFDALLAAVPPTDPAVVAAAQAWLRANGTPFDGAALADRPDAPHARAALFARYQLRSCDTDPEVALACAEDMLASVPELTAVPLSAAFLAWYQSTLQAAILESPGAHVERALVLEAAFAPWKPDHSPVSAALLLEAEQAERFGDAKQAEQLVAVAARIDPENETVSRRKWMAMFDTPVLLASVGLRLAVAGSPLAIGWLVTTEKLRRRRRENPLNAAGEGEAPAKGPLSETQAASALSGAMAEAAGALRADGETAAAAALDLAVAGAASLGAAAQRAIPPALADGAVRSALVDLPGVRVCLVVVPDRDDQPHHAARHRLLRGPWSTTLEQLRTAAPSRDLPCLFLACFLEPEGSAGVLLVGFDDGTRRVLPARLLSEAARAAESGTQHARAYELRFP